jgi:hypothetical protein
MTIFGPALSLSHEALGLGKTAPSVIPPHWKREENEEEIAREHRQEDVCASPDARFFFPASFLGPVRPLSPVSPEPPAPAPLEQSSACAINLPPASASTINLPPAISSEDFILPTPDTSVVDTAPDVAEAMVIDPNLKKGLRWGKTASSVIPLHQEREENEDEIAREHRQEDMCTSPDARLFFHHHLSVPFGPCPLCPQNHRHRHHSFGKENRLLSRRHVPSRQRSRVSSQLHLPTVQS